VDRRFLRPGWIAGHVLVFLAFLTCLRLGWWQWERTQQTTGTAQNFGYALLWPAFGVAFIYMWVRFLRLEVIKDAEDDEETDRAIAALLQDEGVPEPENEASSQDQVGAEADPAPIVEAADPAVDSAPPTASTDEEPAAKRNRRRPRPSQAVTISVAMVGEDYDDDPELTAYNQALAALAEEDRRRAR
jgi:DNA-binding transcriptional regulator of glucitol operon